MSEANRQAAVSEANRQAAVSEANQQATVSDPSAEPRLWVSAGTPSDEELVAVLVALTSFASPAEAPAPPEPSRWVDRGRAIGAPPRPGPGAWVASARP